MTERDSTKDEALIKRMLDRFDFEMQEWSDNWDRGDKDMRALSVEGDWPEDARKDREAAKRPMPHVDIISQYNNRVVNQARMRPRGFKFNPQGQNATDESAQLREDRARQIQYESKAVTARMTAFQNAVDRGFGCWKISVERKDPASFNQSICIERIPNPKSVLPDSRTTKSDRSDMRYLFHMDKYYSEEEFKEEWPTATIQSFDPACRLRSRGWISEKGVRIAQYYEREKLKTRLLLIEGYPQPGQETPILENALPEGMKAGRETVKIGTVELPIIRQEQSETYAVKIYLTNGVEILEEDEWVGTTIPFPIVTGREKYVENKLVIESLTCKMRAPQLAYDFAEASEQEDVGMAPKPKWIVSGAQVAKYEEWKDANKNTYAYLRYDKFIDGQDHGEPKRIDASVDLAKYEVVKNSALRAAQNAVGMTSADTIDRQAKSGVAQKELNQSMEIATFHFDDSLDDAVDYEGRIVNEILDKIEDSRRTVGLRSADNKYRKEELDVRQDASGEVIQHPYGTGSDHGVTVEVGPNFDSQREEQKDFVEQLMASLKGSPLMERALYLLVKLQNGGPILDQLAEELTPPDVKQREEAEKGGAPQIPPQIQAQMQQAQQMNQLLIQELKKLQQVIEAKVIENNARKDIETSKAQFQSDSTKYTKYIDYLIAKLKTGTDLQKAQMQTENSAEIEAQSHAMNFDVKRMEQQHQLALTTQQQAHDADMTGVQHEHEAGMQGNQLADAAAAREMAAQQAAQEPTA